MHQANDVIFDSSLSCHKSPFGGVEVGQELCFSIRLDLYADYQNPSLLLFWDEDFITPKKSLPLRKSLSEPSCIWYTASFTPAEPRLIFYCFEVFVGGKSQVIKRVGDRLGEFTQGGYHWQLTVHSAIEPSPCMKGIVYQIFPDRFYTGGISKPSPFSDRLINPNWGELPKWQADPDGEYRPNDYFGGTLEGVRQKLSYIKSLGASAIYLNPIFEAHSNHRYNTADFFKIDPMLGTEEDFARLCSDAKQVGIAIILDGVFSHTGSDSIYFNKQGRYQGGAYRDKNSPYFSWYKFDNYPSLYKRWWGFKSLPEVNEENESYLEFICGEGGVIDHWMQLGAGGFRLDVADELPNVILDRIYTAIRRNNPTAPIIGEVWEDASSKISYGIRRRYLLGGQLTSVTNYPLTTAIIKYLRYGDYNLLYDTLFNMLENYPKAVINQLLNPISSHDISRCITALVGEEINGRDRIWQAQHNSLSHEKLLEGKKLLRLAAVMQYTLPGTPCLYYGDEVGVFGYKDPFNRACYPWGNEDEELLEFFRELGTLRNSSPALQDGEFRFNFITENKISYERFLCDKSVVIVIDRDSYTFSITNT